MKNAKIVSFINYKGGVGKTTTTYHIGCSLAQHHGKKVLLVDIDPQTNLTFLCSDYNSWERFKRNNGTILTLYERFKNKQPLDITRYIWQQPIGRDRHTKIKGLDLLPCDLDLLGEDLSVRVSSPTMNSFAEFQKGARETLREKLFLKQVLSKVRNRYDYILIDCPPNIYLMTQNALVVSDCYVVTTIPEMLSVIGLQILTRKVRGIGEKVCYDAKLAGQDAIKIAELGGIIFVKVRIGGAIITNQHLAQMETIKREKEFQGKCFEHYTTELIGYSEAAEQRLPIWLANTENARRAAQKKEYENITKEFLERFL